MTTVTPKFYYSTDSGAPQIIANQPQTFLNVLTTCLVGSGGTAYGSQASAGWSAPYEDTTNHALVLQQGSGSGRCLSLSGPTRTSASDANNGVAYFLARGYESMSAVTTGTNPFPTTTQRSVFWWVFATQNSSYSTSTVNIPWRIAATDRFFYIALQTGIAGWSAYTGGAAHYFGDIYSYMSGDSNQTIISGYWTNSTNVVGSPVVSSSTGVSMAYIPFKGSDSSSEIDNYCYIYSDNGSTYNPTPAQIAYSYIFGSPNDWAGNNGMANPSLNGNWMFATCYLMTYGSSTYNLRGEMPGLTIPLHPYPFPDAYTFTMNSDSYIVWVGSANGSSFLSWNIALDQSNWKQN